MKILEDHFLAAYLASSTACDLVDLLPDVDIVTELEEVLIAQLDIFDHLIQDKHYGARNLAEFIAHTQDVKMRCKCLRESLE